MFLLLHTITTHHIYYIHLLVFGIVSKTFTEFVFSLFSDLVLDQEPRQTVIFNSSQKSSPKRVGNQFG